MPRFTMLLAAVACVTTPCGADQPATRAALACPSFSVATKATDKAIFVDVTPAVDGAVYNWRVDIGTINAGQGTASIMIDIVDLPQTADVKVHLTVTEIPNCPKGVSLNGTIKRT